MGLVLGIVFENKRCLNMFIVYDKGTGRKGIIEDTEGEVTEIISY